MDWMRIETRDGVTAFLPGETVEGTVGWHFDAPARSVEVRLLWYTEGKGDQDVGVVASVPLADPATDEVRPFQIRLPAGPYSFSGRLISLVWAVEAVAEPGARAERLPVTVSPTRQELLLGSGVAVAGPG
ncbi:MAG TPA: hypothetical protein VIJ36_21315 [Thermoanaerobaculia bacterium]|jgi:hypothetical protein